MKEELSQSEVTSSVVSQSSSELSSSNCVICKNILNEPLSCSKCTVTCCKTCLISFTIQNQRCPNNCTSFELLFPSQTSHPKLFNSFIECPSCKNLIPLVNYGSHLSKCKDKEKTKRCWNCNTKVSDSSLVCKQFADYKLTANYICEVSFEEDKPFLMQISFDQYKGYATESDKRLIVTDNVNDACMFSQVTIDKLPYLKVFKRKVWKFLGPHYDLGILVIPYGKWAGSIIVDSNKQTILSNNGRTQGLYLTMRKSDKRLFFFKENDSYISCNVNIVPITSVPNIPQRNQS